jgi:hypothetical protein
MKKLITTLALTTLCVSAFAQGKVQFVNDSLHNYYFGQTVLSADQALRGALTPITPLASGISLRADLYAGTTAGELYLYSSTTLSTATPGRQNTLGVTLNDIDGAGPITAIPGGTTPAYFQVQIRDSAFASAALSMAGNSYFGYSSVFTVRPSSTIAYNSIINHGGTALSTWADSTGFPGAIEINVVPEPSTFALAGLGAAAMLIFRRRK